MSEAKKYRTVWEVQHPGEPVPSAEEFGEMQERALARWDQLAAADPTLLTMYDDRRQCSCCAESEAGGERRALSD